MRREGFSNGHARALHKVECKFTEIASRKEEYMLKIAKYGFIVFLSSALTFVPFGATVLAEGSSNSPAYAPSGDEEHGAGEMLFDFLASRPVGIIATATGIVTYLISLPFSVLGGNPDEVGTRMVEESVAYTFKRPLGQL